jgi:hypothetical protein
MRLEPMGLPDPVPGYLAHADYGSQGLGRRRRRGGRGGVIKRWIVAGTGGVRTFIRNVCRLPGLHRQLVDCMPACRWFPSPHRKNQADKASADEEQRARLRSNPDPATATDEGR